MNKTQLLSAKQLLDIFSASHIATAIYTTNDLIIEAVTNAMLTFWGKTRDIVGLPLEVAVPELLGQPFLDQMKNVLRTGETFVGKGVPANLVVNGQLQTRYYDYEYTALYNDTGDIYCLLHTTSDATERIFGLEALEHEKQHLLRIEKEQSLNEELATANEALGASNEELRITQEQLNQLNIELEDRIKKRTIDLEQSEDRMRFILNSIPQQVWIAAPDGLLNYVNNMVCNDLGVEMEAIIGYSWKKYIHPDDMHDAFNKWMHAVENGHEYTTEFRLLFSDGTYHWHLVRAVPLIENGQIQLWLGSNTDIELQKLNEQKKDEFLSIASHELKTPLTSIKAFNQLVSRGGDPERVATFVKKSADHIQRLEKLIADLLDVTRMNAGKLEYDMKPFSFKQLITDSVENIQQLSPNHYISLQHVVDMTITGDHFRLEQVMINFLSNAVKYSPEGKRVLVDCQIKNDNIIVSIQDFGIGIDQTHINKLFDRYYRVDNTAMRFDGLGLGLFISAEIIKQHRGSVWIESTLGQGSTFYFSLPIARHQFIANSDTTAADAN